MDQGSCRRCTARLLPVFGTAVFVCLAARLGKECMQPLSSAVIVVTYHAVFAEGTIHSPEPVDILLFAGSSPKLTASQQEMPAL